VSIGDEWGSASRDFCREFRRSFRFFSLFLRFFQKELDQNGGGLIHLYFSTKTQVLSRGFLPSAFTPNQGFKMASNFFVVHHTFRLGMAEKYFEKLNTEWNDEKWQQFAANMEKRGIHLHQSFFIDKEGPIFCIYEAKATVSDEEFQKFIDGPEALGVHQGLYPDNPLNNTCMKMDLSLRGGEPPLPRHFTD